LYCECGPSVSCYPDQGDVSVSQCDATNAQCSSSQQKVFSSCQ
jgi:hypothetical protein